MRVINSAVLFCILFATWVALSGVFTPLMLALGASSCLFAVLVMCWIDHVTGEPKSEIAIPFLLRFRTPFYLIWLIREIIISGLQVTKIIWQVEPKISPVIGVLPLNQTSDVGRALYANSITLTPGTVSVILEPNQILVHGLIEENIAALAEGEMQARVLYATEAYSG